MSLPLVHILLLLYRTLRVPKPQLKPFATGQLHFSALSVNIQPGNFLEKPWTPKTLLFSFDCRSAVFFLGWSIFVLASLPGSRLTELSASVQHLASIFFSTVSSHFYLLNCFPREQVSLETWRIHTSSTWTRLFSSATKITDTDYLSTAQILLSKLLIVHLCFDGTQ